MNVRNLITVLEDQNVLGCDRVSCSRYSDLDKKVLNHAFDLDMPLIGGTALEILGSHFGKTGFRKRSDNDLDFITNSQEALDTFSAWLKINIDPSKVKTDVMLITSFKIPQDQILNLGGVLVMSPEFLIWQKVQRWSEKDKQDIAWLLTISNIDKLESLLEEMGITEYELDRLNSLIPEGEDAQ